MKFRETYSDGGEVSLGTFYNTDIRKIIALKQYYPMLFHDDEDPQRDLTKRVRQPNSLFFAVRKKKKVFGYIAIDPVVAGGGFVHYWHRKGSRVKKEDVIRGHKLLLKFAFEILKLRRLSCLVPEVLTVNRKLLENHFKQEGVIRKAYCYNKEPHDMVLYGVLKEEF